MTYSFILLTCGVLMVINNASSDDPAGESPKDCINTAHWEAYNRRKSCLSEYITHVLPEASPRMTTVSTTGHTSPAVSTGPAVTTSPVVATVTATTAVTTPIVAHAPNVTTSITAATSSNETTASIANTTTKTIPSKGNCLTLSNVKNFFIMDYKSFATSDAKSLISQQIRLEILDKVFQESKLKEFKPNDLNCFKHVTKELKSECLMKELKYTNKTVLPKRVSNALSKNKKLDLQKTTCDISLKYNKCVKAILAKCGLAMKIASIVEEVMSKRCKDILKPPPTSPKTNGLSTLAIVIIALLCIIGAAAVIFGVLRYLKNRRNRGTHTVTRNTTEECEMVTRSRPSTK